MWTCKSCLMENEDKDPLCYMCGTKRPHTTVVRKKTVVEPQRPVAIDAAQTADSESGILPTGGDCVIPQASPTADGNLFASAFNAPAPQEVPTEPPVWQEVPVEQPVQQPSFSEVFNDFLNALQQIEPQKEYSVPEEKPAATPPPEEKPTEEINRKREKKQLRTHNRKAVAERVVAFLRVLFAISLCAWLFCLCVVAFTCFAENDAGSIRFIAEELYYSLARRLSDVYFFTWPELVEHFLSVISTL